MAADTVVDTLLHGIGGGTAACAGRYVCAYVCLCAYVCGR